MQNEKRNKWANCSPTERGNQNALRLSGGGAGLFGAAFAQQMHEAGKSVLVIERRNHNGGKVYTEKVEGIQVHRYGAHIFHTDSKKAWEYVNQFAEFNRYTNAPIANYRGELYSLPFNMYTFHQMWGVNTPQEAVGIITTQRYNSGIVASKIWKSRPFPW